MASEKGSTRSQLTSMSISIAAKVRARSAGDQCRPRPTMRPYCRSHAGRDDGRGRLGPYIRRPPCGLALGVGRSGYDALRQACCYTRTQGCAVTNLQYSLSRKRMVFAAMRQRRTTVVSGTGVSGLSQARLCSREGLSPELLCSDAAVDCPPSIVASRSRKSGRDGRIPAGSHGLPEDGGKRQARRPADDP
jgi:hypothetical protein